MDINNQDFAQRIEAIINTAIDGIITIDHKGVVETINKAALNLFGYEEKEVIGNKINNLMPNPYKDEHDGYVNRYLHTKEARIIGIGREVHGQRKDGSIFPFRLAVSEVILNNRIIFTGIIHDLSEVKQAQEEILKLNEELEIKVMNRTYELEDVVNKLLRTNVKLEEEISERLIVEEKLMVQEDELRLSLSKEKELSELKSRFVSMASHEFRTPLATILSSAAIISRYEDKVQQDKRIKHIERIKSSVVNLTGILNDFLSISKLEEGKVEINYTPVSIIEVCTEIEGEVQGILKKGQFIIHECSDAEKTILTDKRILKNILFNLLSNSIKYSHEGSQITCRISFNEEDYLIEIQDKGIGIPDDDQKHMFERFFRAANVTNIQGTGLGLNIVKRYVELLEGSITFESTYGEGTSFFVKLPYIANQYEENTSN